MTRFVRIRLKLYRTLSRLLHRHHEDVLGLSACVVYVWLVFEKLSEFPIYFFCDEAMLGVDAYALLTTGADFHGVPWPLFFEELGFYSHSISVYFNMPFIMLFGLNEFSIRLTTACISILGVAAVYALIRVVYQLKFAWLTFVVFAVSPLWFLHSRTGFEYVMAASFFLAFGLFYILAFTRQWWFVFPAALCAAGTFYAHTTGRGWIGIALLLLFVTHFSTLLAQWRRFLIGVIVLLLLLAPYLHLHFTRPDIAMKRLESLNRFHTLDSQSVSQRVSRIVMNYVSGVNPLFWYTWEHTQNSGPMERHIIPPLSLIPQWTFPFACLGVLLLVWRIRTFENRTFLMLFLAAPTSAALVELNIHRGLSVGTLLIVFGLVGAAWGLSACFSWMSPPTRRWGLFVLVIGLGSYTLWFRQHVSQSAPYAYRNYGFYGVQMGAPEVFAWIQEHHQEYEQIQLSHNLFNAGHIFIPFYILEKEAATKIHILDLNQLSKTREKLPAHTVYIARPSFSHSLQKRACPIERTVRAVIRDKKGRRLFEILSLRKGSTFPEWFQQETRKRRALRQSILVRENTSWTVRHHLFDLGNLQAIFDGRASTLARTDRINPAYIHIRQSFAAIQRILVTVSHNARVSVQVVTYSGDRRTDWGKISTTNQGAGPNMLQFVKERPIRDISRMEISITDPDAGQAGHVHINEIAWE